MTTIAIGVFILVQLLLAWGFARDQNLRRRVLACVPMHVEQYVISGAALEGTIPEIRLTFSTGSSQATYAFPPGYAHKLSDELCQAAAMAMRPVAKVS